MPLTDPVFAGSQDDIATLATRIDQPTNIDRRSGFGRLASLDHPVGNSPEGYHCAPTQTLSRANPDWPFSGYSPIITHRLKCVSVQTNRASRTILCNIIHNDDGGVWHKTYRAVCAIPGFGARPLWHYEQISPDPKQPGFLLNRYSPHPARTMPH